MAWTITAAAQSRKLQISIESASLSGITGFKLSLLKGPVDELSITTVSFCRPSQDARGSLWQSLLSGSPAFPISLDGIHVKIRKRAHFGSSTEKRASASASAPASPRVFALLVHMVPVRCTNIVINIESLLYIKIESFQTNFRHSKRHDVSVNGISAYLKQRKSGFNPSDPPVSPVKTRSEFSDGRVLPPSIPTLDDPIAMLESLVIRHEHDGHFVLFGANAVQRILCELGLIEVAVTQEALSMLLNAVMPSIHQVSEKTSINNAQHAQKEEKEEEEDVAAAERMTMEKRLLPLRLPQSIDVVMKRGLQMQLTSSIATASLAIKDGLDVRMTSASGRKRKSMSPKKKNAAPGDTSIASIVGHFGAINWSSSSSSAAAALSSSALVSSLHCVGGSVHASLHEDESCVAHLNCLGSSVTICPSLLSAMLRDLIELYNTSRMCSLVKERKRRSGNSGGGGGGRKIMDWGVTLLDEGRGHSMQFMDCNAVVQSIIRVDSGRISPSAVTLMHLAVQSNEEKLISGRNNNLTCGMSDSGIDLSFHGYHIALYSSIIGVLCSDLRTFKDLFVPKGSGTVDDRTPALARVAEKKKDVLITCSITDCCILLPEGDGTSRTMVMAQVGSVIGRRTLECSDLAIESVRIDCLEKKTTLLDDDEWTHETWSVGSSNVATLPKAVLAVEREMGASLVCSGLDVLMNAETVLAIGHTLQRLNTSIRGSTGLLSGDAHSVKKKTSSFSHKTGAQPIESLDRGRIPFPIRVQASQTSFAVELGTGDSFKVHCKDCKASMNGENAAAEIVLSETTSLSLNGKPLIHCTAVDASFERYTGKLTELDDLERACCAHAGHGSSAAEEGDEKEDWSILSTPRPPASTGTHAETESPFLPAGLQPYRRAGLQSWLAGEKKPGGVASVKVGGVEICLPHDQDPGKCQRLLELNIKALKEIFDTGIDSSSSSKACKMEDVDTSSADCSNVWTSLPLQLSIVVEKEVLFRFEHHPMESWLLTHSHLLQSIAAQRHAWQMVTMAVPPTDSSASPLRAGVVEAEHQQLVGNRQELEDLQDSSWTAFEKSLAQQYIKKVQDHRLHRAKQCSSDLFVVSAQALSALLVIGAKNEEDGIQHITKVDAGSAGVSFVTSRLLHVDCALSSLNIRTASRDGQAPGGSQPLVSAPHLHISGVTAVGRQSTSPPQLEAQEIVLGRERLYTLKLASKFTRAPWKVYSDLRLEGHRLTVGYSQGQEPVFGLIAMAGKRLVPNTLRATRQASLSSLKGNNTSSSSSSNNNNNGAAAALTLPWWDELRYLWRGGLHVDVQGFGFSLGAGVKDSIDSLSERVHLVSSGLRGSLLSEDWNVCLHDARGTLYTSAGIEQLGGALLALPFIHLPVMQCGMKFKYALPGGRGAGQHHLFPLMVDPGTCQVPISIVDMYKAEGIDIEMDCHLGDGQSTAAAIGYIGDHQVLFWRTLIRSFKQMPLYLKAVSKRGTYFVKKTRVLPAPTLEHQDDAGRPAAQKKSLPKLLRKFRVTVRASPLELVHTTLHPMESSNEMCVSASAAQFGACFLMNQPMPHFFTRMPPHALNKQLPTSGTRTITSKLRVTAEDVKGYKGSGFDPHNSQKSGGTTRGGPVQERWSSLLSPDSHPSTHSAEGRNSGEEEGEASKKDDWGHLEGYTVVPRKSSLLQKLVHHPGSSPEKSTKRNILLASHLMVTQEDEAGPSSGSSHHHNAMTQKRVDGKGGGGGPPDDDDDDAGASVLDAASSSRPLRVRVSDCKLLVDLDGRNAVWGTVAHLVNAFSRKAVAKSGPSSLFTAHSHVLFSPTQTSAAQRRQSLRTPSQSGELPESQNNELLNLLLRQREEGGQSSSEESLLMRGSMVEGRASTEGANVNNNEEEEEDDDDDDQAPMSTPLDDMASQLKYEVEVANLQINLDNPASQGRLLLAARNGRLRGLHQIETGMSITTLSLQQVEAYVAQLEVDPDASIIWLQTTTQERTAASKEFIQPEPGTHAIPFNRIFNPITIDLRHSKAFAGGGTTTKMMTTVMPKSKASPNPSSVSPFAPAQSSHLTAPARGEELVIKVPAIAGTMESSEFAVLVDAVGLMLGQAPSVEHANAEMILMCQEAESEDVEEQRQLHFILRKQLAAIRQEAMAVRQLFGLELVVTNGCLDALSSGSGEAAPLTGKRIECHYFVAGSAASEIVDVSGAVLPLQTALREHISAIYKSDGAFFEECMQQKALLLRWIEDQESGAEAAFENSKATLRNLKALARKRQHGSRGASRVLLQLDRIVWQLCTKSREPFVQASLRGLALDLFRNKDHSGSAKFIIHRIEVLDAQGNLPAAPGIAAGIILAVWNPDQSWERDDAVRVVATMGPSTPSLLVFEHLDATLHPLAVHLTESIAVAFWEYFFPKEDKETSKRKEAFMQSFANKPRRSAPVAAESPKHGWQSPPDVDSAPSSPALYSAVFDSTGPHSGSQSPHKEGGGGMTPKASGSPLVVGGRPCQYQAQYSFVGEGAADVDAETGALAATSLSRPSPSHAYPFALTRTSVNRSSMQQEQQQQQQQQHFLRLKKFVYVKLNRAHMRVTYEGYPLTFTDLKLVLDNRTYQGLDGRWRDLFAKIKWDVVKSVIKSVAGLQGRKMKELFPTWGLGGERGGGGRSSILSSRAESSGSGKVGNSPAQKGLLATLKESFVLKTHDDDNEVSHQTEEELVEEEKRRLLLGGRRKTLHKQHASPTKGMFSPSKKRDG